MMTRSKRIAMMVTVGALTLAAPAVASAWWWSPPPPRPVRHSVPEFDPSSVGTAIALLVGGGYLLGRRGKSK